MNRVFAMIFSGRGGLDSFADRLSCRVTVCILLIISILAMLMVFICEPVRCFAPLQFTTNQAAYAEEACWLSATYSKLMDSVIPDANIVSERQKHAFYRWIPLILAIQAFFFYIPKLFWNLASSISGSINVRHVISSQTERQQSNFDPTGAVQNVQYMSKCLSRDLVEFDIQWKHASASEGFWLLLRGNCTIIFYILVKLLYFCNCLFQLILVNVFLGGGLSVLHRLSSGTLEDPGLTQQLLPRRILCEFEIRQQSRVHAYVVQCVLPLNFWYEIVFLFLWFWLILVFAATLWSLTCFVISMANIFYQERYCRLRLMALSKANAAQTIQVSQFVHNFLTRDAWFIVQKVGTISGDQTATELVCGLWENYIEYRQQIECTNLPSS